MALPLQGCVALWSTPALSQSTREERGPGVLILASAGLVHPVLSAFVHVASYVIGPCEYQGRLRSWVWLCAWRKGTIQVSIES